MFDIKSFYEADSVEDAIAALTADPQSQVISGGTDVLIRVREGKDAGRGLVSIHNIPELKGVSLEEDGTIIIRPATSFSHITNDPIIKKHLSMLGEAVDQVGGTSGEKYGHHRREYLQWGHLCGFCLHHVRPECCSGVKRAGGSTGSAGYRILYRPRTYGQEAE